MSNRFGGIVDIDKKFAHIVGRRAERFALCARPHFAQPATERVIDDVFQSPIVLAPEAFNFHGYVVVDRQGGSHTSKHRCLDVLMSKDRADQHNLHVYLIFPSSKADLVQIITTLQHVVVTTHKRGGCP
jgi:hypothetical protein